MKSRLARSCVKTLLDPSKPFGAHYGAIIGLQAVGGTEAVRVLILPNLFTYGDLLKDGVAEDSPRRPEAEKVLVVLLSVLASLRDGHAALTNGHGAGMVTDELKERLDKKLGGFLAEKVADLGDGQLVHAILVG